jgi:protein subunit release factor B
MMDMPPERIDVAFSIFDVDGELKVTLSSVMKFVQNALKQVSEDDETMKTDDTEVTDQEDKEDKEDKEEEEEEEEEEDVELRNAIRAVIKGASWVARSEKRPIDRVIRDAFLDNDVDSIGKVTTGQVRAKIFDCFWLPF